MWPNPQETVVLVTFPEEILNGKLHFLCSDFGALQSFSADLIRPQVKCNLISSKAFLYTSYLMWYDGNQEYQEISK